MTAGDMTGLVSEDANDLVGRFRIRQCAGVNENPASVDKGVEAAIVDEDDVYARPGEARRFQDRLGIFRDQGFDLRIAHDGHSGLGKGRGCRGDSEIGRNEEKRNGSRDCRVNHGVSLKHRESGRRA